MTVSEAPEPPNPSGKVWELWGNSLLLLELGHAHLSK